MYIGWGGVGVGLRVQECSDILKSFISERSHGPPLSSLHILIGLDMDGI